jgi:DNA-binding SARP family transcriptional activator
MSLTIQVLGPLVIESNGCRLDKLPKKARALLAFLAAQNGEAVSRERLADLLWPYQGSEQGRHSLRNCLLELRKALGRGAASDLEGDFANCRIENAIVDLDDFERLSRSQDRGELHMAADLYRGDFSLISISPPSRFRNGWGRRETARLLRSVTSWNA